MREVDTFPTLADQANADARRYVTMASEDNQWNYLLPLIEARRIELTIPQPSPFSTDVVTPEERDALQARIDAAQLALAAIDNSLNRHNNDDK